MLSGSGMSKNKIGGNKRNRVSEALLKNDNQIQHACHLKTITIYVRTLHPAIELALTNDEHSCMMLSGNSARVMPGVMRT